MKAKKLTTCVVAAVVLTFSGIASAGATVYTPGDPNSDPTVWQEPAVVTTFFAAAPINTTGAYTVENPDGTTTTLTTTKPCKTVQGKAEYQDPVTHQMWARFYLNVRFCYDANRVYSLPGTSTGPRYWVDWTISSLVDLTWDWGDVQAVNRYWYATCGVCHPRSGFSTWVKAKFTRCWPFPKVCSGPKYPAVTINVHKGGTWSASATT